MKRFILALLFMLSQISSVVGQSITDNLGVGFNIGGQKIFCDYLHTGFGIGIETYLKYRVNKRLFVTGALGYGELSDGTFHLDKSYFNTNLITLDVKGALNLMPDKTAQPYIYLGLGVFNFRFDKFNDRFFDGSFILGGGLEYMISPIIGLNAYADYRYTTGDDLDGIHYGAKDGYLNMRGGVTYYLSSRLSAESPKILADKVPLDEIEDTIGEDEELNALMEGIDNFEEASGTEFAMEEYIKLKSRVDQLNDAVRQKELEIEELKAQLEARKEKVTELEQRMRNKGGALASSINMNVSNFSSSYEQGLEHFYALEFDAAIYIFNMLLESYPNHRLASNCRYWTGECYFGQQNYESALESFRMVSEYEKSVKKDDSLLMMGRCYIKMGNGQMARQMFDTLMNDYPDSEYFYKAEKYASEL